MLVICITACVDWKDVTSTCQLFSVSFNLLQKSCNLVIHLLATCDNYHTTLWI